MQRLAYSAILVGLMMVACGQVPPTTNTTAPAAATPTAAPAAAAVAATAQKELQVAPQESPSGDIEFKPALDLGQTPAPGEPQLRNGQVAQSADWPASLYVTFPTKTGTGACTAALLGPRVMLTAAHCVPPEGSKVTFAYAGHKQPYATTCTKHPNYPGDPSADFALCALSNAFEEKAGFRYESVNATAMDTLISKQIILTGFGCVSDIPGAGPMDGKYRIGTNAIDETSTSNPRKRHADFYAPKEKNNVFTTDSPGTANLCPGDSGGPAFLRSGGGGETTFSSRTIIGVNSRVFYANPQGTAYGSSLVSATGGPDFLGWAQGWAAKQDAAACGIVSKGKEGILTKCRS